MNFDYIITDYITGKPVRNMGPEASRQIFEKFLVNEKGYAKEDIKVDQELIVQFKGEDYISAIDLIVSCNKKALWPLPVLQVLLDHMKGKSLQGPGWSMTIKFLLQFQRMQGMQL